MAELPSESLSILFEAMKRGEEGAEARLFDLVYGELRKMAHGRMLGERSGPTLQTTALVNEACLRLMGKDSQGQWENRRHFFGAAARAMRQILVDRARRRDAVRRGSGEQPVSLDERIPQAELSIDLLALDQALTRLAGERPFAAEVVHYRFFLGFTVPETAEALGVSPRKIDNDWKLAKAWLHREMSQGPSDEGPDGF